MVTKRSWWHVNRPRPIAGTALALGSFLSLIAFPGGLLVLGVGIYIWRADARDIKNGSAL